MNILFVVDSLYDGGAGHVVARLASYFQKQGFSTAVLPVFDNRINYQIDEDVKIFTTYDDPLRHSVLERIKLIRTRAYQAGADIVISFLSYINLYSIVAGIGSKWKTIVSERNNPYTDPGNRKIRAIRKYLYLLSDGFVFQTEDARDYFFNGIRKKSKVIPNPIADDIPDPYHGIRTKRIVSVGRLTNQKNYSLALRALAEILKTHPEFNYEIYGQGEEEENIRTLIRELGIEEKVILKGHVSGVVEKIKDATVFLLSSDYEGMSNSLMEALAVGLPVVSTDHPIGGARKLINNGDNGILIPVGDIVQMKEAVARIIETPNLSQKLSMRAAEVREKYSTEVVGDMWIEYISELAREK